MKNASSQPVKAIKAIIQKMEVAKISLENLGSPRMKPHLMMEYFGLTLGEAWQ